MYISIYVAYVQIYCMYIRTYIYYVRMYGVVTSILYVHVIHTHNVHNMDIRMYMGV